MILESRINVPYNWWAGDTASRFLIALRDETRLIATRCKDCGSVTVPPRKSCPACFTRHSEWVSLPGTGTVTAFTVARRQLAALPKRVPVIFALIMLDGADTALLHHLGGVAPDAVHIGLRVTPVFADDRKGHIMDIRHFKPLA
jgi:uncharacterized OB-fold protein